MGLDEVKQEIIARATQESQATKKKAEEEANSIIQKSKSGAKDIDKAFDEQTKNLLIQIERRELASARSSAKKKILDKKKSLLDNVLEKVSEKLATLSDKKREQYIQGLLEKAKNEIKVKYVYANKKDKKHIKSFTYQEADIIGGIIVENADRTLRVDYSFEQILEEVKENKLQEFANSLF